MINSHQILIGSVLLAGDEIIEVESFSQYHGINYKYGLKDLSPMPITPEALERLGFRDLQPIPNGHPKSNRKFGFKWLMIRMYGGPNHDQICELIVKDLPIKNVTAIHQVQFLAAGLIGEMLKFKI